MHRRRNTLLTAVLTGALLIGMGGPAFAADSTPSGSGLSGTNLSKLTRPEAEVDQSALDQAVIARFDPYVTYAEGTRYVLNAPADVVAADPAGYAAAQATIANTNATLAQVTGLKPNGSNLSSARATGKSVSGDFLGTHGSASTHWWGVSVYLDHWATGRLAAVITVGAAASTVAALVTSWTGIGGLSAGGIAAILALGVSVIKACDWNDRGIGMHLEWVTVPLSWCWAR